VSALHAARQKTIRHLIRSYANAHEILRICKRPASRLGKVFSLRNQPQLRGHNYTSNKPQCNSRTRQGFFTARHAMQTRYSDENSVRPSVRLSVTRVNCDKISVHICIPCKRQFSLVYWVEERLVGATPSTWNFGSTGPRWSKIPDFEPIIARSASAVTSGEKSSINANKKSNTRFPMSLRWSSYVSPKSPKGGLENAWRPISVKKSHFDWRKSATKFLRVKTFSGKVVKHSLP